MSREDDDPGDDGEDRGERAPGVASGGEHDDAFANVAGAADTRASNREGIKEGERDREKDGAAREDRDDEDAAGEDRDDEDTAGEDRDDEDAAGGNRDDADDEDPGDDEDDADPGDDADDEDPGDDEDGPDVDAGRHGVPEDRVSDGHAARFGDVENTGELRGEGTGNHTALGDSPARATKPGSKAGKRGSARKGKAGDAAPPELPGAGTPDGEKLREAHRAFEAGDYRRVRELCDSLIGAKDAAVASAADELRKRTEIDPVQVAVLIACLVFFAVIVYVYAIP